MTYCIRDAIVVPVMKPRLLLEVGEVNDQLGALAAREYVVTDSVSLGLPRILGSIVELASKGHVGLRLIRQGRMAHRQLLRCAASL